MVRKRLLSLGSDGSISEIQKDDPAITVDSTEDRTESTEMAKGRPQGEVLFRGGVGSEIKEGERVLVVDGKGFKHIIKLREGQVLHLDRGVVSHTVVAAAGNTTQQQTQDNQTLYLTMPTSACGLKLLVHEALSY
jgi:hypothetical protein